MGLGEYAAAYGIVNTELRDIEQYKAARVHLQDSLVRRARAVAFALLASAISSPGSPNEQYQALVLARDLWTRWSRRRPIANCSSTASGRPTSRRVATVPLPRARFSTWRRRPNPLERAALSAVRSGRRRTGRPDDSDPDRPEHVRARRGGELLEE